MRQCVPISQKIYKITKRLKTPAEEDVEQYFPGFLAFIDSTEQQQIPRPIDKNRRKMYYSIGKKKKRHTIVKNQIMVNNHRGYIIHKAAPEKGRRYDYDFYKKNHPSTPSKQVVNVFYLGYLRVEKDYPTEQLSSVLSYKRKETNFYQMMKKRKRNSFQQKEDSSGTYHM